MQFKYIKGNHEGPMKSRKNDDDPDDPDTPLLVDCWNVSVWEDVTENSKILFGGTGRPAAETRKPGCPKRVSHVQKGNRFDHCRRRTDDRAIVNIDDARPWAIVASPVPANRTNTIITPPSNTVVLCETVTDQARRVAIAAMR